MATTWDEKFFESTRGQIVVLLRRSGRTVEELARALGLTDNGIRAHLAVLERDGIARQRWRKAGLRLRADPTTRGTFSFVVRATDTRGAFAERTYSITVN